MARFRSWLSYANVMSTVAVFLALAGGAYAVATIGPKDIKRNAVRSKHIKKHQVKAQDLRPGAVRVAKVAPDAIDGLRVLDSSLTTADLSAGAVRGDDIAVNQIGSQHLSPGSVQASELGPVIRYETSFQVGPGTQVAMELGCQDADQQLLSGGGNAPLGIEFGISESYPTLDPSWAVLAYNTHASATGNYQVYVLCLDN